MKIPLLVKKRECFFPTAAGWAGITVLVLSCTILLSRGIHPFLAENKPLHAEILIVEGWMPDYGLIETKKIFQQGHYQLLLTTGGPLEEGSYLKEFKCHANVAAATLKKLGIQDNQIIPIPAEFVRKDRTWQSALAFEQWLSLSGKEVKSIDLVSLGAHSRRSAMVFRKVLNARKIEVGVISIENRDYYPDRWWVTSAGVKTVIEEVVSCIYTSIFYLF